MSEVAALVEQARRDVAELRDYIGVGIHQSQYAGVAVLMTTVEKLCGALEERQALLARIAPSAVRYDSRVYRLTEDFVALVPYLSDEDVFAACERPSETDARVEAERDAALAELELMTAQHRDDHIEIERLRDRATGLRAAELAYDQARQQRDAARAERVAAVQELRALRERIEAMCFDSLAKAGWVDANRLHALLTETTEPEDLSGMAVVASLPDAKYRLRRRADGWDVLTIDDGGAFS